MDENKTKVERIRLKLAEHILSSAVHGLPNVLRTTSIPLKLMWSLLFAFFTSVAAYMLFKGLFDYLKYEVITNIDIINESPTLFPAITFYNLKQSNLTLKDVLISCHFNDVECNSESIKTKYDEFNNIYFQFNIENKSFLKVKKAGKKNALRIKLFTGLPQESDKLAKAYTDSEGFHVTVHNQSIDPEYSGGLSTNGISVPVGFETSLIIEREFSTKQPEPYNNCKKDLNLITSFDSTVYQFMIKSTQYAYRQRDCFEYCLTYYIFKECQIEKPLTKPNNYFMLNSINSSQAICFNQSYYKLTKHDINELCSNSCPLECDSIVYKIKTSSANFPDFIYAQEFLTREIWNQSKFSLRSHEGLKKCLLAFNVYYSELSYTLISQLPKMDLTNLVSNIGGLLGLFIGVSFLSLAEIIEITFELTLIFLSKKN